MLVLGIDTTTEYLRLSILNETQSVLNLQCLLNQTEQLSESISLLLQAAEISPSDLNCIGVVTGPGGYTSTRAGVVLCKTMAQVLNCPLFGINKLEWLLYQFKDRTEWLCPILDVRQNEWYTGIGRFNGDSFIYRIPPAVVNAKEWEEILTQFKEDITMITSSHIPEKPAPVNLDPISLAALTRHFFQQGLHPSLHTIVPFYPRLPVTLT